MFKKLDEKIEKLRFYLGDSFPGVYFTHQEARCILHCLKGMTDEQIGRAMRLSKSTISVYLMNMRRKLKCKSKKQLIAIVKNLYKDGFKIDVYDG